MPDWSYHTIFKPILSNLQTKHSREFIHRSMGIISKIPFGTNLIEFLGHMQTDDRLQQEISGITFKSPIGLSSAIDPNLSGTNAFMNLGFGFLEIGPISVNKSLTNRTPIINLKDDHVTEPSIEYTIDIKLAEERLSKMNKKVPLFARINGNLEEFRFIDSSISKYVDMYVIESSLLEELNRNEWNPTKPVCLSINLLENDKVSIPTVRHKIDSVLLNGNNLMDQNKCRNLLIESIKTFKSNGFETNIFTSGGIIEPIDAITLFNAGATFVLLSHGYVISGPGLPKRINEALLPTSQSAHFSSGWKWYFLFGFIMFIGGLLAFMISLTTVILPYDEYFLKTGSESILLFNDRILPFMSHDRMTLSGTIMSGGILYMALARFGIRFDYHWAKKASDLSAIIGFLAIFYFVGFKYFDWLHAIFWLILLPPFLIGFWKTKSINRVPSSRNLTNHPIWKKSLIGQLSFISLGFSLIIGGIMISYVGMTTTFVNTDLAFLCVSPEQIQQFNNRLIPVISHDRAGFGGSLVSVGLLVLMISLWGFREGEKWIWWTLLFGSLPAFVSAIGVHVLIGYTDFVHLLPPFIALLFLLIGLTKSYHYFHYKSIRKS